VAMEGVDDPDARPHKNKERRKEKRNYI